ncbi:MAG: chromosome segregation protein SMC [Dethiosulfovibrio peptidovorans]|nr:MAG: chromosome segregation protein SMC [Dethiosulfovibrio peptidovorans]
MYIARLQLKNFKSFGGTHDLPLPPGFTAIVGPNGSGKSNILDGLRWGLGDSSGGRLRITKQADLLFQGTATHQPARATEVVLELRDGTVSSLIRRRYSDETGAVTLVDGDRYRLQDLSEVKRRWRLDGDRFAFIGQGDVTDAITQRPMQRRSHLEELFGIDVYRKRRDDALAKIAAASEELIRLSALSAELEARKNEIAPLVSIAHKAQALEEKLSQVRSRWYRLRRMNLEALLLDLKLGLANATDRLRVLERWALLWERGFEGLKGRSAGMELRRLDIREKLLGFDEALDAKTRESFEAETALRLDADRLDRLNRSTKDLRDREEQTREELTEAEILRSRMTDQRNEKRQELAELEARAARIEQEIEAHRLRREELVLRQETLRASLESAVGRKEALTGTGPSRRRAMEALDREIAELEVELAGVQEREETARRAFEAAEADHRKADERCRDLAARIQPLRKKVYQLEREHDTLSDVASGELYPRQVSHLMGAADLGRLTVRPIPVLEAFDCPEDLVIAMDAALGARQFWLLVETMDDAREGIEELKRSQVGRVTYLSLDRSRPRKPDKALLPDRGVVGWAVDLLELRELWRPALEHIFGDLLIVEDYSVGASLLSRGIRYPVVTREGEVFAPGGTVSGGQSRRSGRAIQARGKLHQVEDSLRQHRRELRQLEESLKEAEAEEERVRGLEEVLRHDLAEVSTELLREKTLLAEHCRDRDLLLSEEENTRSKLAGLESKIKTYRDTLTLIEEDLAQLLAPEGQDVQGQLAALRPEMMLWDERLVLADKRVGKAAADLSSLQESLKKASAELLSLREHLDTETVNLNGLKASIQGISRERDILRAELESTELRGSLAGKTLDRCLNRYQEAAKAADEAKSVAVRIEQKLDRESERLEDLIVSWDSVCKQFEETGSLSEGENELTLERRARRLEGAIASLGDVNRGVLSEDISLTDRIEFYSEQTDDVSSGIAELRTLVDEMDRQAGTLFGDALERIDRRFDGLFQRLFGGGEAHLRLQEGSGLWEAGVEIVARPPGKVPAYLAQLSGGEQTLTALSLLFAAMEVAQVPVVVLDEVDAALDEVNLHRFADIITDYASSLQIVAMTHRRQTMERADVMYGVTMSEPGLSQIVGVKLEDWR